MQTETEQQNLDAVARRVNEIDQEFAYADFWNTNTRPRLYPDRPPTVADPYGELAAERQRLVSMLHKEAGCGNPQVAGETPQ